MLILASGGAVHNLRQFQVDSRKPADWAIAFDDWMMLDLRYIDHWTLASDLLLIAKTVPVVLTGRGAS